MNVSIVRGDMERKTAPFSLDRKGYHVSWDAIPAWVCTQCGEPYFEAKEVGLIQKALTAMEREGAALVGTGPAPAKS
jgi:YgiT-type zinc finger domain-containing protein